MDTLTPSKLNHCEIRWWGGNTASLHVLFVEDEPQDDATLTVTITGTDSGAWSVDGGTTWKDSGESVAAIAGTAYYITFKAVEGYTTPASQTITLAAGSNTLSAIYAEDASGGSTTTASYTVTGIYDFAKFAGTYTLTSGSDGDTDAIYTKDGGGAYIYYYPSISSWCIGTSMSFSNAMARASSITGTWESMDSDYAGGITSIVKN